MGEVAARLWTGFVNRAEIPVEEDTAFRCTLQNSRRECIRISRCVLPHDLLGFVPQVASDGLDFGLVHGHCGVAAAIRANGAVNLLLYLRCEYLKRPDSMLVAREMAAEIPILRLL